MQFNEARCLPADFAHSKKFEVNFKTTLSIDSLKYSNKSLSLKYLKILKKKTFSKPEITLVVNLLGRKTGQECYTE